VKTVFFALLCFLLKQSSHITSAHVEYFYKCTTGFSSYKYYLRSTGSWVRVRSKCTLSFTLVNVARWSSFQSVDTSGSHVTIDKCEWVSIKHCRVCSSCASIGSAY